MCLQVPTLGVGSLGGAVQLVPALGLPGVQLAQLQQTQQQTAQPLIGKLYKLCINCVPFSSRVYLEKCVGLVYLMHILGVSVKTNVFNNNLTFMYSNTV